MPSHPTVMRPPPDTEQVIRQGLQDLDQLRRSVGEDPAARHEIDELVRSMKNLDPKRFPGNPAMVDELYARVLERVDKLELQLRHEPGDGAHNTSAQRQPATRSVGLPVSGRRTTSGA